MAKYDPRLAADPVFRLEYASHPTEAKPETIGDARGGLLVARCTVCDQPLHIWIGKEAGWTHDSDRPITQRIER